MTTNDSNIELKLDEPINTDQKLNESNIEKLDDDESNVKSMDSKDDNDFKENSKEIDENGNNDDPKKPASDKSEGKTKTKKAKVKKSYGALDSFINQVGVSPYTFSVIVIFSFLILVDGGEMTVVSLLITKLTIEWQLDEFQKGLMGSSVFIGFFIGTLTSGKMSDIYGRKPLFLLGNLFVLVFAISSAFTPNFLWFTIFRGLCGFGVGLCLPASAALSAEICPSKYRGILINALSLFFPLGEIITALVAKSLINSREDGWRFLLGLIAIPMLIAFILSITVRESPRFLANDKQFNRAFEEIENLLNHKVKLTEEDKQKIKDEANVASANAKITSSYSQLFSKNYIFLNLAICFILFTCSFIYYGVVYVLPQGIERNLNETYNGNTTNSTMDISPLFGKKDNSTILEGLSPVKGHVHMINNSTNMTDQDLNEVFDGVIYSALSEIPSPLVAVILVNLPFIGRRYGIAIGHILTGIFALMCILFNSNLVLWGSLLKFAINIPFSVGYLYVTEAFPTKIRSIAIGFTNSFTRIGGIITPIISQSLFEAGYTLPYVLYCILAFAAAVVAFFLPVETYGRVLE